MSVIEVAARADVPCDLDALVARVDWACERLGVARASLGLMVVGAERMAELNHDHRGKTEPTDVLSFPIDGPDALDGWPSEGPAPELGDIVICPAAADEPLETLAIHGLLHLVGYDHEVDEGEMLALQDELVAASEGAGG